MVLRDAMDEMVYLPRLLLLGRLIETEGQALAAIARGQVAVQHWTISIAEAHLPRWVLRGVTITISGRSMRISDDGSRIVREPETLTLS